jgi:hypothetical protein
MMAASSTSPISTRPVTGRRERWNAVVSDAQRAVWTIQSSPVTSCYDGTMAPLLSTMKRLVIVPGSRERTIRGGPLRGIKMNLDLSFQTQMWLGLFEREIFSDLIAHSRGIRTALDIGVGYGDYTLYFLLKTQAERVIACEPSAEMQSHLFQNLRLNGIEETPRLEVVKKFVTSYVDKNEVTLDELASSVKPPILVKMDVDTFESKVLRGASEFLRLPDVRWIVETHSKALEEECVSIFQQAGYRTKVIRNAWWRLFVPDLRPIEHNRWLSAIRPERGMLSFGRELLFKECES